MSHCGSSHTPEGHAGSGFTHTHTHAHRHTYTHSLGQSLKIAKDNEARARVTYNAGK